MALPILYPKNPRPLVVRLTVTNPTTGKKEPLNTGTTNAIIATSDSPYAVTADATFAIACILVDAAKGDWLIPYTAGILTAAIDRLESLFGEQIPSGVLASDAPSRADSAATAGVAASGQAWRADFGTFGILTNRFYSPTSDGTYPDGTRILSLDAGLPGLVAAMTLETPSANQSLLVSFTDVNNALYADIGGGLLTLRQRVGGVSTTLKALPYAPIAGDRIEAERDLVNQTVMLRVNRRDRLFARGVTTLTTATRYGLLLRDNVARVTDFSATTPAVPSPWIIVEQVDAIRVAIQCQYHSARVATLPEA